MLARTMTDWPDVFRRNPFAEMELMRREMDLLTGAMLGVPTSRLMRSGVFPAVNLTEDKDNYYARAELPGISSADLEIQVAGRSLILSGERKIPTEGNNVKYHRREREAGTFSKVIGLPGDINADNIGAKMTHGMLTVTIPKSEAAKPRQISVK